MRAIAAILTLCLLAPSTVLAQDTPRASDGLRESIDREAARLAKDPVASNLSPQQAPQRTWVGRHPVGLGAIIGASGGAIWGAAVCAGTCNGSDGQTTQLWMGIGAGIGAAIGAGIGAIVSAVRR